MPVVFAMVYNLLSLFLDNLPKVHKQIGYYFEKELHYVSLFSVQENIIMQFVEGIVKKSLLLYQFKICIDYILNYAL